MKIKQILLATVVVVTASVFGAASVQAVPVEGTISFYGQAKLNPPNFSTATTVSNFAFRTVAPGAEGDFSSIIPFSAYSTSSVYDLDLNPNGVFQVTFSGFTFTLTSSVVNYEASGLVVNGFGYLTGNGYDSTYASWSFASDYVNGKTGKMNYVATITAPPASVPDGGTTAILLGATVVGLVLMRRKFATVL